EINSKFFANDKASDEAKELVNKIKAFKETALANTNSEKVKSGIQKRFNTDPVVTQDGTKQNWLNYNFEGFPLVAGITKLTNIQANVKQTESEILSNLFSGQLKSDVSLTNYEAIVIPDKTAFFAGENFTGKVVLGRVDKSMSFEGATVNGHKAKTIEAGQIKLDFPAGNVGDQTVKGDIKFKENGETKSIPFTKDYNVIPMPN